MEPVGLAIAVASTFKDVLFVARFISRALSADANAELQDIHLQFQHEVLFLSSLHKLLLSNEILVQDESLNEEWLRHVRMVLGKLHDVTSVYSYLAAKYDTGYREHLSAEAAGQDDFRAPEPILQPRMMELSTTLTPLRDTPLPRMQTLKWLFSDKQKIKDTVQKYRKWNARLKDLMFLAVSVHSRYADLDRAGLEDLEKNIDSQRIGLSAAASLRLSVIAKPSGAELMKYAIDPSSLVRIRRIGGITRALARKTDPSGFSTQVQVIIEYKSYFFDEFSEVRGLELQKFNQLEQNTAHLVMVLSSKEWMTLSSLSSYGYFHDRESNRFWLVLEIPSKFSTSTPISLVDCLGNTPGTELLSLDIRLQMAVRIARSLEAFHAIGWVHKSIRSDSILFFINDEKGQDDHEAYASPFISGFEFSRIATGPTDYTYDDNVENNLYRHPERQGLPQTAFTRIHDIYSLGVILLEIGLWKSVVTLYKRKAEELARRGGGREFDAAQKKVWLISRAEKYLPYSMGSKYKDVVVLCLSGNFISDPGRPEFSMEFHKKVVQCLQSIKVS
jgi:hypothetical protein